MFTKPIHLAATTIFSTENHLNMIRYLSQIQSIYNLQTVYICKTALAKIYFNITSLPFRGNLGLTPTIKIPTIISSIAYSANLARLANNKERSYYRKMNPLWRIPLIDGRWFGNRLKLMTLSGRLICPEGRVSSLNKCNPNDIIMNRVSMLWWRNE